MLTCTSSVHQLHHVTARPSGLLLQASIDKVTHRHKTIIFFSKFAFSTNSFSKRLLFLNCCFVVHYYYYYYLCEYLNAHWQEADTVVCLSAHTHTLFMTTNCCVKHPGQSGRLPICSFLAKHHIACQQMSKRQTLAQNQSKFAIGHLMAYTMSVSCEDIGSEV